MNGEPYVRVGELLAARYRVMAILDAGAMGTVVRARDLAHDRDVAVKIMHRDLVGDESLVGRFRAEARAAASLRSPHVVRMLDEGARTDGTPFLVMELLRGVTLADRLAAAPLSNGEALTLALALCDALAEAHGSGIVHRDLKPANVFLAEQPDGSVVVKVLDFGIAKSATRGDALRTETGVTLGTPRYMSPEQMVGATDVDERTDVWAIGVILYEALTGRPPYDGATFGEILLATYEMPTRPIAELAVVDPDFAEAVMSCLLHDRASRCPSVQTLRRRLEVSASVRAPVEARPTACVDDDAIVDALRRAADARPDVIASPARFRRAIQRAVAEGASLAELHTDDLYLAIACVEGDTEAAEIFEREIVPALGCAPSDVRDAMQRLVDYRARAPLTRWLSVVARRLVSRASAPENAAVLLAERRSPELATLRAVHGPRFDRAAETAWRTISAADRTLLRFEVVDRLGCETTARLLGSDADDIRRRIETARRTALELVRRELDEPGQFGVRSATQSR